MSVLINLRQAIIQKISNKTDADVEDMIVGSVDGDERALPGLGVLFELIWKESSPEQQQQYITIIQQHLSKNS
ncbi:small acid-soluble spore protein SspI [Paenibacillus sp. ACRRX]|uniref:small acid-soluble spore protein SspI n=1 Tax=unclassified Paenibacillus TaxID=185978 RepID=UPI001EF71643|nr:MULTISPECIES: small acid-soluble spore protein SspI [unclassified Paenibacillus]MCG7410403.1 small acid-soluble spore protein SspI [Paenibacillus sp. ACRRX]MDK8183825.1 small acid-soluble spore protein SspI [Paenibacillus sp. UMB4589-SE434]